MTPSAPPGKSAASPGTMPASATGASRWANGGIAICPSSLKPIGIEALFSPAIEIDHILPYSRTLDDTLANRILCYREASRGKRRQSPHEWLGRNKNWESSIAAASGLPGNTMLVPLSPHVGIPNGSTDKTCGCQRTTPNADEL